jgi:hypothetical protein
VKKEVRKISTLTLFNLDAEVVFHTNDVTLNSSIENGRGCVPMLRNQTHLTLLGSIVVLISSTASDRDLNSNVLSSFSAND